MLKNYLKIAWRNLFKNKGFSVVNLLGLTIGITCSILIFLWVQDEVGYNKFHTNYNNIYKVMAHRDFNNTVFTDNNMVLPLAKALEESSPQIKNAVVTTHNQSHILAYGDVKLKKNGHNVSEHFFDLFSFKFIKGNAAASLEEPTSMVVTKSAAKALFGNDDPINKVVKIDKDQTAYITAVIADPPRNSNLQFDYIMPFNYSDPDVKRNMSEWVSSSWDVYIQTMPGADMKLIDKTINAIKKQHDHNDEVSTYFTFPMSKWRLYSDFKDGKNVGGMIEYVRLFTVIALIILVIACINFMNLSTARSEKRSKEVGIRKTLGSERKQIILQFFCESMIISLIAFVFSVIAVLCLLPSFNLLVDKQLSLNLGEPVFWAGVIAIILLTGIVAGSYPALYLSSFSPVKVLKGTYMPGKSAALPRRVLVVSQFVISILLISATFIVYRQIQHIKNRDMGYNPDNLIMIPSSADLDKNFKVIKQELLQTGLINSVTRTSSPITDIWWYSPSPEWDGKPADANIIVSGLSTDVDFTKTMGIKVLKGEDFKGLPVDSSKMMLNKAAVDAMGLKNPIGLQMRYGGKTYTVTGITDNVVMSTPYKPVDPMMIYYSTDGGNIISLRLANGVKPQKALQTLEATFKKYNPAFPFEYQFVDQEFQKKFLTEELISKITNIFAGLAIFICCIGVAGLASFTIEKRIREIGIRKVLGATIQQLLMLISKEFLRLVSIAFIIAVPLTWWLMSNWLEKYTFKTDISIWMFGIVGLVILLLTLAVVTLNTISAVVRNPVKSLRTE